MKRLATLVLAVVLFAGAAGAIDADVATLKGLVSVWVAVENFRNDVHPALSRAPDEMDRLYALLDGDREDVDLHSHVPVVVDTGL